MNKCSINKIVFESVSKDITISGPRNNIITQIKEGKGKAAYGATWIESNTNRIHKWRIKFHELTNGNAIGFANNIHPLDFKETFYLQKGAYSYFTTGGGRYIDGNIVPPYPDTTFSNGDICTLILDLSSSTIRINKNNAEKDETLFTNIPKGIDIKYKFVASLWGLGRSIEVTKYNTHYN